MSIRISASAQSDSLITGSITSMGSEADDTTVCLSMARVKMLDAAEVQGSP